MRGRAQDGRSKRCNTTNFRLTLTRWPFKISIGQDLQLRAIIVYVSRKLCCVNGVALLC